MIKAIHEPSDKASIAKKVLHDLPEWFGLPEATAEYIKQSKTMPFFAKLVAGEAVGFASLKATSPHTAELYCIGVMKDDHKKGYGKALVLAIIDYAKTKGYHFLQVKTVAQGNYDLYDHTLAFYKSLRFYELEVFPTLWDKNNPCQVLIMALH